MLILSGRILRSFRAVPPAQQLALDKIQYNTQGPHLARASRRQAPIASVNMQNITGQLSILTCIRPLVTETIFKTYRDSFRCPIALKGELLPTRLGDTAAALLLLIPLPDCRPYLVAHVRHHLALLKKLAATLVGGAGEIT